MTDKKSSNGLDQAGYILNPLAYHKILAEFLAPVDGVVQALHQAFSSRIHSIYLYGSVPRGEAKLGYSDLDVCVIFHNELGRVDQDKLHQLACQLGSEYPQISKLDIDPGVYHQVLEPTEKYRWQFWLKQVCCCIWGYDLAKDIEPYRPHGAIAYGLNGDLETFMSDMASTFARLSSSDIAKIIGKKLIRSAYYLIATKDGSWHTDLARCAKATMTFYPNHQEEIRLALALSLGIETSEEKAMTLFERFAPYLVQMLALQNLEKED